MKTSFPSFPPFFSIISIWFLALHQWSVPLSRHSHENGNPLPIGLRPACGMTTFYEVVKLDVSAKSRHSGGNRSPGKLCVFEKNWIPAFAGMTEKSFFTFYETNKIADQNCNLKKNFSFCPLQFALLCGSLMGFIERRDGDGKENRIPIFFIPDGVNISRFHEDGIPFPDLCQELAVGINLHGTPEDIEDLVGILVDFVMAPRPFRQGGERAIRPLAAPIGIKDDLGLHVEMVERRVFISGVLAIHFHFFSP
jgi:hypothetical protein